jgi:hypothetical protein
MIYSDWLKQNRSARSRRTQPASSRIKSAVVNRWKIIDRRNWKRPKRL